MTTSRHILLEKTLNTRDLGGMVAADGKKIRSGMLIRSGNLAKLTAEGAAVLQQEGLGHVIDFRTAQERRDMPDVEIGGVTYQWLPIFGQAVLGVTREDGSELSMRDLIQKGMAENPAGGKAYMASMYALMVTDDYSKNQYKEFMRLLAEGKDGAILWHCSAGKDRVGMATLYILTALGVPWETVLEDYLMTNIYTRPNQIRIMQHALGDGEVDATVRANFEAMLTVDECYLAAAKEAMEQIGGSMLGYIQTELGVDDEMLAKLRSRYLES